MKKNSLYKKNVFSGVLSGVSPLLFTLAVAVIIFTGLRSTEKSSAAEGLRTLNDSILRATVKCYAVEGSYPENIAYLEKNYKIYIDKSRYIVDYEIFASNIMPSIKVMELKK